METEQLPQRAEAITLNTIFNQRQKKLVGMEGLL